MAGDNYSANLADMDESGLPSSATDQLTRLGIDPTMARANPELLASLGTGAGNKPSAATQPPIPKATPGGPMAMPTGEAAPAAAPPAPSASAMAAGKAGDAGAAAVPAAPDEIAGYGKEGLGLLKTNLQNATTAAGEMSTTNPELEKLQTRAAAMRTPGALFDPTTGKRLDQTTEQVYNPQTGQMESVTVNPKPGAGQRIWRGVRGGLIGLMRNGIRGGILGAIDPEAEGSTAYGAPSTAYQKLDERRQQELASTEASEKDVSAKWKEAQDAAKARASEYRANATLGKDLTTGAVGMEDIGIKRQHEANEATRLGNETPEAKAREKALLTQEQLNQRQTFLNSPAAKGLSSTNRMLYLLNGKVPDPREPNEGEITAANAARALVIFKAQHAGKGPQTLEDFNAIQQAARGDLGKGSGAKASDTAIKAIQNRKDTAFEKAEQNLGANRQKMGTATALSVYQRELQAAQSAFENEAELAGVAGPRQQVMVDNKGAVTWKPVSSAPAAAPAPGPSAAAAGALGGAGAPPPVKPMPAPDGTRRQAPDGSIEVKRAGQWVKE